MENKNPEQQVGEEHGAPGSGQPDFESIPRNALRVISDPVGFFRDMEKSGGYLDPLIFMVVLSVISGLISALLSMFGLGIGSLMVGGFIAIVLVPIYVIIFGFIGAGIAFVIWKLMGSQENFETAFRCVAYCSALAPINAVLSIIPYVGSLVSALWPMALMAIASIHVHKRSAQLAWGVFGALGIIVALSSISGERTSRQLTNELEKLTEQMEEYRP